MLCHKQVSRAGKNNYIPQIMWDVINCPCFWYLHQAPHFSLINELCCHEVTCLRLNLSADVFLYDLYHLTVKINTESWVYLKVSVSKLLKMVLGLTCEGYIFFKATNNPAFTTVVTGHNSSIAALFTTRLVLPTHIFFEIETWICNYTRSFLYGLITNPWPNFVEVRA